MRLEGKVALITGAARGQGAAEAWMFAQEGAKVILADVTDQEGLAVAAEIAEAGGDVLYVHLDVTNEEEWDAAIQSAVSSFGKLNILVNNAGIWRRGHVRETSSAQWDDIMDVNAKRVFLGTKAAIPERRKAGRVPIVHRSSPRPEILQAVSTKAVAEATAVVDRSIRQAIQWHALTEAQVHEACRPVDSSIMSGRGVAIGHDRFGRALPASQEPADYPQHSAFRVAAAAVVQPEAGQSNDLPSGSVREVTMDVVGSNPEDSYAHQSVIGKDTEVQEATTRITAQVMVSLT